MTDCNKYIEQISCLIDGELDEEQEAELRAHLDSCESCKRIYDAFMAISDGDELEAVPEGFCEDLMQRIGQQKRSKPRLFVYGRFTALAACLALLIYGGSHFGLFDASKNAVSEEAAPEQYAMSDSDYAENDTEMLTTAGGDGSMFVCGDASGEFGAATSSEDGGDKYKQTANGVLKKDPAVQALHNELDAKFRLGETRIYEGDKATSKRFLIASAAEADTLLALFDCKSIEAHALPEKPNFTIVFADGVSLRVWFIDGSLICRTQTGTVYTAIGTVNTLSYFIELSVSSY